MKSVICEYCALLSEMTMIMLHHSHYPLWCPVCFEPVESRMRFRTIISNTPEYREVVEELRVSMNRAFKTLVFTAEHRGNDI